MKKKKKYFTKARSLSYKVTLGQRLLLGSNPERNGRGVDDHVEVLRIMIHLVGSPGGSPLDLLSRLKTNLSGSTATQ